MIEYAQHGDCPEYTAVAAALASCACSRHVVLEVVAHTISRCEQQQPVACMTEQGHDQLQADDSSASEHGHLQHDAPGHLHNPPAKDIISSMTGAWHISRYDCSFHTVHSFIDSLMDLC